MSARKDIRSDNTYIISTDPTDNPKLGAKILTTGKESLFLDYYFGFTKSINKETGKITKNKERRREFLKLYLWQAPRTPQERLQNKKTLDLAKNLRYERSQDMLENMEGYRIKKETKVNFHTYFKQYIKNYTKKDIRMIELAYNRFTDFLAQSPAYKRYSRVLRPDIIDKDMMTSFAEYLQTRSKGEGAKSIFQRFKKVINYAVEHEAMKKTLALAFPSRSTTKY